MCERSSTVVWLGREGKLVRLVAEQFTITVYVAIGEMFIPGDKLL